MFLPDQEHLKNPDSFCSHCAPLGSEVMKCQSRKRLIESDSMMCNPAESDGSKVKDSSQDSILNKS